MKKKYLNSFMKMTEVFAETSEAKRLKVVQVDQETMGVY